MRESSAITDKTVRYPTQDSLRTSVLNFIFEKKLKIPDINKYRIFKH